MQNLTGSYFIIAIIFIHLSANNSTNALCQTVGCQRSHLVAHSTGRLLYIPYINTLLVLSTKTGTQKSVRFVLTIFGAI